MRYITNEDHQVWGTDLINVSARAARDALAPELDDVRRRQAEIAQREQRLQNKMVFDALDKAMPNWRTVNNDPRFLEFLAQSEEFSGVRAHDLLLEAFSLGQVPRILAFFNAFLTAMGQAPAAQAQTPSVGRTLPRPPARAMSAADATKALTKLYEDSRKGRYVGKEAEYAAEERRLHTLIHQRRV